MSLLYLSGNLKQNITLYFCGCSCLFPILYVLYSNCC